VVGGYTTTTPLRSVLAFRPGQPVRDVATLPHPLRYAAVAAVGQRILVAGGTTGLVARREVLSVDPATHRVQVIAHLPAPLAHAGGAALNGIFYVVGGRGDTTTSQRSTIWAIDPSAPKPRSAGRLPARMSDVGAVAYAGRLLVVGGRNSAGASGDILRLRAR
jgi:hypothetical protein